MLNKKLMIITIFLIGLLAVGAVSASDNTTDDNMIGEEPNTDLASQDTDVLTADEQSFTQLNQLINVNGNSEITLTSDYKYSDRDDSFKEGIVIDHDVTINGNGHTIDGNDSARIFKVTGGNVVFYNIIFTKGHADDSGGAINGKCKAINCTFSENHVTASGSKGGAMYEGSAINCTFTKNSAELWGGAMMRGSARDCTFNYNTAERSGGGAMWSGSAVNCTFNYNNGVAGGAIGGRLSAVNCSFTENSVGAGISSFICNCIGQDYYIESKELVLHWDVHDFTSSYNSGNTWNINLKNQENLLVDFINYDIVVYRNDVAVRTYHCLSNDDLSFDLAAGNYTAELIVTYPGLNNLNSTNITLTINKATPKIEVSASDVTYPNNVVVNVKTDVSGEYTVKVGDMSQKVDFVAGIAKDVNFTDLAANEKGYAVNVTHDSKNYTGFNDKAKVIVHKATPKIEVTANDVTYPDNVIINIKSNVTGKYIVKVGANNQTVDLVAGIAKDVNFTDLAANEKGYVINVTHVDAENYTVAFNGPQTVKVHKAKWPYIETWTEIVYYPSDVVIHIESNVTGHYIVKVGDKSKEINLVADVGQEVVFSGLAANEKGHVHYVSYPETENYTGFTIKSLLKVYKAPTKLTASAKAFKFEDKTKKYTATLKDNKGQAMKNTKVSLKVNGVTYTATTNANGVATFALNKLTKTGNAVISYPGDKNYKQATKKVKLTVKAPAFKTVSYGSKNKAMVKKIQRALKNNGFYIKENGHYLKVDGIFHKYTVKAVKQFQKAKGLKVTGSVDYKTAKKLKIVK